jgi:hypothetical protein
LAAQEGSSGRSAVAVLIYLSSYHGVSLYIEYGFSGGSGATGGASG